MKAKVIKTGEIVMVEECGYDYTFNSKTFRDNSGKNYLSCDLEFIENTYTPPKKIDWEQRRFELAKSALNGLLSKGDYYDDDHIGTAKDAIKYADAVIAKLKEG